MVRGYIILIQLLLGITQAAVAEEWQDQSVLHINTVSPHSTMVVYANKEAALKSECDQSYRMQLLNDDWYNILGHSTLTIGVPIQPTLLMTPPPN